jgi:hypothetical protein
MRRALQALGVAGTSAGAGRALAGGNWVILLVGLVVLAAGLGLAWRRWLHTQRATTQG